MDALLNEPDNQWLLGGNLGAEMAKLNGVRVRAEAVSSSMLKKLETVTGRTALMAGGIALKLSADPKNLMFKDKRLDTWLLAEFKSNRNKIQEMNNESTMASLDRQVLIRYEILRAGLPGDPTVRGMWVKRSAAQER